MSFNKNTYVNYFLFSYSLYIIIYIKHTLEPTYSRSFESNNTDSEYFLRHHILNDERNKRFVVHVQNACSAPPTLARPGANLT